jgi:hypothetical protein
MIKVSQRLSGIDTLITHHLGKLLALFPEFLPLPPPVLLSLCSYSEPIQSGSRPICIIPGKDPIRQV